MARLLAFAFIAVLSLQATRTLAAAMPIDPSTERTYYWNHPKLGPVKVDAATGAMVVPGRTAPRQAEPPTGTSRIGYWRDPKGSLRTIRRPV